MTLRLLPTRAKPNPLAELERLPGWWRGRARVRVEAASEAYARGADREGDEHMQIAAEFERRLKAAGEVA